MQKYEVGTFLFSFIDKDRTEVLGNGNGFRKIPVKLYYPVERNKADEKS